MTTTAFHTDTFLPYMRDVIRCERSLGELNLMWRMIESSARMNCPVEAAPILPTMAATRDGFEQLERELVESLVREKVMTVHAELATKAQYVIDIVVRNLYERTADVGFLAVDDELCRFVANAGAGGAADPAPILERLRAYRSKYTVYDEIILLDTKGNVLLNLDQSTPLVASGDPLLARTLAADTYVETFGASDLRPGKRKSLIYSRRMLDPVGGAVIGVLCLCFNFEEELAGIFHSHRDPGSRSNMLLIDGAGVVVASADPAWIPAGSMVPVNQDGSAELMMLGGRQHLVRTFAAAGYQGYPGPAGWMGQVMIPLDVAFSGASGNAVAALAPEIAAGLLSHAESFCPPLHDIVTAAQTIQRVVWNGQVMTAGQRGDLLKLKVILNQISETGKRSDALFSQSIGDLYDTALVARLRNAEFGSHLLVDLVDRNLYERANDCRWWALTPELRRTLADPRRDRASIVQAGVTLDFINSLYTVYTRLFVYDQHGTILAASNESADDSIVGGQIEQDLLRRVLALPDEQAYAVTPFVPSTLYGGRPTYVYHAAIRDPDDARRVVGGIGIVFDSAVELDAMMAGALAGQDDTTALLVDRGGMILASNDPARPVGSKLALDAAALALPNGRSAAHIVVHDGNYAILAITAGAGYREFKQSDGYHDDILAVVFDSLGVARKVHGGPATGTVLKQNLSSNLNGTEFATFFVDGGLFAIPAEHVAQALPASQLSSLSMGASAERIGVVSLPDANNGSRYVWVFDLRHLLTGQPSRIGNDSQIVVVQQGSQSVGLLVGALHGVPQFDASQIVATPFAGTNAGTLVPQVIKANGGDLLIQVIDPACLLSRLFGASDPVPLPAAPGLRLVA